MRTPLPLCFVRLACLHDSSNFDFTPTGQKERIRRVKKSCNLWCVCIKHKEKSRCNHCPYTCRELDFCIPTEQKGFFCGKERTYYFSVDVFKLTPYAFFTCFIICMIRHYKQYLFGAEEKKVVGEHT